MAAEVHYGETFPSVVIWGNVWGTQFHPEKSAADGLALVRAFVAAVGATHASPASASPSTASPAAPVAVPA